MPATTFLLRGTVADHVVIAPKTCETSATVRDLRHLFDDDHVHLALLTRDGYLHGCVSRGDLNGAPPSAPALSVVRLDGRTIDATQPINTACKILRETGARRLAVIDPDGRLVGLLCLKRSGTGFCSDADGTARVAERAADCSDSETAPQPVAPGAQPGWRS